MTRKYPITNPQPPYRGRFSESDSQKEYVACISEGLGFAASGPNGEWLYYDPDTHFVSILYPETKKVAHWPYSGLDWIDYAKSKILSRQ